jgi:hypothetical protein
MLSIDFEKAYRQTDMIERIAKGFHEQIHELETMFGEFDLVWSGETSKYYRAKLETFIALMKQNACEFSTISNNYQKIIDMLVQAEEGNVSLLNNEVHLQSTD